MRGIKFRLWRMKLKFKDLKACRFNYKLYRKRRKARETKMAEIVRMTIEIAMIRARLLNVKAQPLPDCKNPAGLLVPGNLSEELKARLENFKG